MTHDPNLTDSNQGTGQPRRWFQFRLLHLFALITVAAIFCWWWTYTDARAIQGAWEGAWQMTIRGNTITMPNALQADGSLGDRTSTFVLDEQHGYIDFTWQEAGKANKQQGLYKIEGGTLTVVMGASASQPRPTAFDPSPKGAYPRIYRHIFNRPPGGK